VKVLREYGAERAAHPDEGFALRNSPDPLGFVPIAEGQMLPQRNRHARQFDMPEVDLARLAQTRRLRVLLEVHIGESAGPVVHGKGICSRLLRRRGRYGCFADRPELPHHAFIFANLPQHTVCPDGGRSMIELRNYDNSGFDRGAPRWMEVLWMAIKAVFFLNPIPWPSALRVAFLRMFGAKVGERVVIRSHVNVSFPWFLEIGDDVWLGEEVCILSLATITIESDVCISQRAFLCAGSHDFRTKTFDLVTRPITVRRGSWIAAQAFIGPNVEIGEGSLVSAGSVVLDNVPAKSLVRGNPAVAVRSLE